MRTIDVIYMFILILILAGVAFQVGRSCGKPRAQVKAEQEATQEPEPFDDFIKDLESKDPNSLTVEQKQLLNFYRYDGTGKGQIEFENQKET